VRPCGDPATADHIPINRTGDITMKLAHARIVTNDVPRLTRFYRELTGMTPKGDDVYVEFHASTLTLAISSQRIIERFGPGETAPSSNRSMILDFEVADVDRERKRLAGLVGKFVLEPTTQSRCHHYGVYRRGLRLEGPGLGPARWTPDRDRAMAIFQLFAQDITDPAALAARAAPKSPPAGIRMR